MKRVLHIITGLTTGGAETMLHRLLAAGDRERWAPSVLALGHGGPVARQIEALGIEVHCLGIRTALRMATGTPRLIRQARALRPDLVQGWMYHGSLAASLLAGSGNRAPLVWSIRHALHDPQAQKAGTARVIRLCARLSRLPRHRPRRIVYNSSVAAEHHEALGYARTPTVVIPNGFDCERFRPSEEARADVRAELGLEPRSVLIGLVARHHALKGHRVFLRAAARLVADDGESPECRFLLIGRDTEPTNPQLAQWIEELGLEDRVLGLGEREDTPRLTAALDLACSVSSSESFSNTLGEAMACGVPCVATAVGEAERLMGETGWIVPPGDPDAVVRAWQAALGLTREQRVARGLEARRRILDRYDLRGVVRRFEQLWSDVLELDNPAVGGRA